MLWDIIPGPCSRVRKILEGSSNLSWCNPIHTGAWLIDTFLQMSIDWKKVDLADLPLDAATNAVVATLRPRVEAAGFEWNFQAAKQKVKNVRSARETKAKKDALQAQQPKPQQPGKPVI